MKFQEFKRARTLILENRETDFDNNLVEYLNDKYSSLEHLDEASFVTAIANWFRKHLSPTAKKLRDLANEYYEWLMNEYASTYKGRKDDSVLDEFYRKERVSKDIEDKMESLGEKHEVYKRLASSLILDSRLKAKKDFATRLLGATSRTATVYTGKYNSQHAVVDKIYDEMNAEDRMKFQSLAIELSNYIHQKDNWTSRQQADDLSLAILKWNHIKKDRYTDAYTIESLKKNYDNCESRYFDARKNNRHDLGVLLVTAVRTYEDDPRIEKKKALDGKDLDTSINAIMKDISSIGINVKDSQQWGFIEVYCRAHTKDEREELLDTIDKFVAEHPDELSEMSKKISGMSVEHAMNVLKVEKSDSEEQENVYDDEEEKDRRRILLNLAPDAEAEAIIQELEYDQPGGIANLLSHYTEKEKHDFYDYTNIDKTEKGDLFAFDSYDDVDGWKQHVARVLTVDGEDRKNITFSDGSTRENVSSGINLTRAKQWKDNKEKGYRPEDVPDKEETNKEDVNDTSSLVDDVENFVIDNTPAIKDAVSEIALVVGTAEANSAGKVVISKSVKNDAVKYAGLDPMNKGLEKSFVEYVRKEYISSVDSSDASKSKLNDANVNKEVDIVIEDIVHLAARDAANAQAILDMDGMDIKLLALRVLKYKEMQLTPVNKTNIEAVFGTPSPATKLFKSYTEFK